MTSTHVDRPEEEEAAADAGEEEDTGAHVSPIVRLEEVAVTTGEEDEDSLLDLYLPNPSLLFSRFLLNRGFWGAISIGSSAAVAGRRSCIGSTRRGISGRSGAVGTWSSWSIKKPERFGWWWGRPRHSRSAPIILVSSSDVSYCLKDSDFRWIYKLFFSPFSAVVPSIRMQEHAGNDKSCVWHAMDFSDGELKEEMFAIRFGSVESEPLLPYFSTTYQLEMPNVDLCCTWSKWPKYRSMGICPFILFCYLG